MKLTTKGKAGIFAASTAAILSGLLLARACRPLGPVPIIYSRQTTYFTGPVRADGTIDYAVHLEAILGEGVTAENNAVIPLIVAAGPG